MQSIVWGYIFEQCTGDENPHVADRKSISSELEISLEAMSSQKTRWPKDPKGVLYEFILPAFKGATLINSVYQYRAERLDWDMLEIDHCNHKFHYDQPWWSTLVTQVNHLLFQQPLIVDLPCDENRIPRARQREQEAELEKAHGLHGEWWRKWWGLVILSFPTGLILE